jgi:hypothetical protein
LFSFLSSLFFLFFWFLIFIFWLAQWGLHRNTATGPRQAMVEAVALKQALEGEGEAFVRVRGSEELP